jgi:hypothetical protein
MPDSSPSLPTITPKRIDPPAQIGPAAAGDRHGKVPSDLNDEEDRPIPERAMALCCPCSAETAACYML